MRTRDALSQAVQLGKWLPWSQRSIFAVAGESNSDGSRWRPQLMQWMCSAWLWPPRLTPDGPGPLIALRSRLVRRFSRFMSCASNTVSAGSSADREGGPGREPGDGGGQKE
jgi:hypothetical protein